MNQKLSKKERENLLQSHRQERDRRVCDRIKAVLAYDDGYSYAEIAKILLLDDETIRRHVEDYFCKVKLKPENGGSNSHLSVKKSFRLKAHLEGNTYLYVKDICAYVKNSFNKKYSVSGMTKWLHSQGLCYKKPHGVSAKANKKEQEKFMKRYEQLIDRTRGKEPIYFVDSVHPHHQTRLTYGWILKGVRKEIAMTGRQYRLNLIGGINLDGHKLIYNQVDKVDGDAIGGFLLDLRKRHPEKCKLHIIWDNAGYHRDKRVIELAKDLAIKLHYLPPYSPNLNPIERLWKIMHEWVTNNRYYETFLEFSKAIINFFKTIGRNKKILRTRITDSFRAIQSPLFSP